MKHRKPVYHNPKNNKKGKKFPEVRLEIKRKCSVKQKMGINTGRRIFIPDRDRRRPFL